MTQTGFSDLTAQDWERAPMNAPTSELSEDHEVRGDAPLSTAMFVLKSFAVLCLANLVVVPALVWLDSPGNHLPKDRADQRPAVAASTVARYDSYEIPVETGGGSRFVLRYRRMRPDSTGDGGPWPLVVFLHGAGERGNDNVEQLRYLPEVMLQPEFHRRFPCFLVAPQCPQGRQWTDTDVLDAVSAMIAQELQRNPSIDRQRVYLTGLSMGGFGCWKLAARQPELFAAVVPICSGGDPLQAPRLIHVPVWAVHGEADDVVPAEQSRRMVQAIRDAGGHPLYSELKAIAHDSWTPAYNDPKGVLDWMFRQRRAQDLSK